MHPNSTGNERVLAELSLELLKEAIDSSVCGVTIADAREPDMPLIYINEAFSKITGYEVREVLGKNCRFLQGDLDEQPDLPILREAIRNRESCTVLLKNFKKNGELFWNELILSPILNADGELTHFVGIQNDVTERETMRIDLKRREQELRMTTAKLKKLLDEKNKLLSIVAHDLRRPLSNIIGIHQLMEEDQSSDEGPDYREITLDEARNAYDLVNNLLNKQSIESGKLTVNKKPTDLVQFSEKIAREMGRMAALKGIDLEVNASLEQREFSLDPIRVKQVLQNLVDNAIKFSERGTSIEIDLRSNEVGFCFNVRDQGQGISKDELDKIFKAFESGSSQSTEGETGFGIGLSIVQEIVELHGGQIDVESEIGKGTCFSVMLW